MAPTDARPQPQVQYNLISDSDSDTLAPSVEEKSSSPIRRPQRRRHSPPFLHRNSTRRSRRETRLTWLRWGAVLLLQSVMIVLLALRTGSRQEPEMAPLNVVPAGGDINGIYHESKSFTSFR